MKTFGERLKHLIKHSDIKTIRSFSKKSGFSEVAVSNIIKGKSKPGYDFIMACITVFPNADANWLLTGESKDDLLRLENKQLREQVKVYQTKLTKAVKLSSNRKTSQLSFAFNG